MTDDANSFNLGTLDLLSLFKCQPPLFLILMGNVLILFFLKTTTLL